LSNEQSLPVIRESWVWRGRYSNSRQSACEGSAPEIVPPPQFTVIWWLYQFAFMEERNQILWIREESTKYPQVNFKTLSKNQLVAKQGLNPHQLETRDLMILSAMLQPLANGYEKCMNIVYYRVVNRNVLLLYSSIDNWSKKIFLNVKLLVMN
jgi:hypothetical protein